MGELANQILKYIFRTTFILATVTGFLAIVGITVSLIGTSLNQSIISDLIGIMQIWLPFNMSALLWWIVFAPAAYIAYRLGVAAYSYVGKLTA